MSMLKRGLHIGRFDAMRIQLTFVVVMLVAVLVYVIGQPSAEIPLGNIRLCAHRGLVECAPENTLAAFRAAVALRFDVELDVYATADNEIVVMHDTSVDRTTNGAGYINTLTSEYVTALDAGSWYNRAFSGERVPTLRDALRVVRDGPDPNAIVAINLKVITPEIERRIVAVIQDSEMIQRVICFGMSEASNQRIKDCDPRVKTAVTTGRFVGVDLDDSAGWRRASQLANTDAIWTPIIPTKHQVAMIHSNNKRVYVHLREFPTRKVLRALVDARVDVICSDHVLKIRKMSSGPPDRSDTDS